MRIILMYSGRVGDLIAKWLIDNYRQDIGALVAIDENSTYLESKEAGIHSIVYKTESQLINDLSKLPPFDYGFLAWWPNIVSPNLLNIAKKGFINTHPSLLPYNRGKHYNFWALVEQSPFGVSLHFVDEGIDSGDLIAQTKIEYNWEDTGKSLYVRAGEEMFLLFKATYPNIRIENYDRTPQDLTLGSLHYGKELDAASKIDLDKSYMARKLINTLRARTFPGYPACQFEENGNVYEITVDIKRKFE